MNIIIGIFRTIFFYFLIILSYRLIGKKKLNKLDITDLIFLFFITEISSFSIMNNKSSIWFCIILIIILVVCQLLKTYISLKNPTVNLIINDRPIYIIKNSKIMFKELLNYNYSLDQLLLELKKHNFHSIDEVSNAILNSDCTLTIFPIKDKINNATPLSLIIDGEINYDNLSYINKDEKWLLDNINDNIYNIFYAFYQKKKLYLIKQNELFI